MSSADVLNDINSALQQQPAGDATPATGSAADVLSDIAKAQAAPTAFGNAQAQLLPAAPYGATDAAVHGLSLGLSDAGRAGIMALGRYLRSDTPTFDYSRAAQEVNRGREAYAANSPFGSLAANMAGGLAGPVGPAISAINAVSPFAKIGVGALTGGGIGAVQGAADNNTSFPNALSGAGRGAEIGAGVGAAPAALGTLGRAAFPAPSTAAQTLIANGVNPPPGAATGGFLRTMEDIGSRIPLVGAPINAARAQAKEQLTHALERNAEDFNRGIVNNVLEPIGESLSPNTAVGNPAIAEMQQKITDAYHAAIPGAGGPVDTQLNFDINNAVNNARLIMPKNRADQFEKFVNSSIGQRIQNPNPTTLAAGQNAPYGTLSGQALKDADTDLGREAASYTSGNVSPDERKLGNAYRDLQTTLRGWIARVTPQNAQDLQNANDAWARQLRVNNAAGRNIEGVFTPQNLAAAAKLYSSPAQYARGGALMQDLAQNGADQNQALIDAGRQILRVPVNGAHGIGPSVIGANMLEHFIERMGAPGALIGGLAYAPLGAAYSNGGRRMVNGLLGASLPSPAPLGPAAAGLLTQ